MWRIAVCTWNVQGLPPPSAAAVRPLLLLHSFIHPDSALPEPVTPQVPIETVKGLQTAGVVVPDIYAICLQEADLSAEALIRNTGLTAPLAAWEACISDALTGLFYGAPYTLVRSKQLGGLALFVYARSALLPRLAGVLDGSLPFGFGGVLANKGAVAIRMLLGGVACLFIGAHLTPHTANAEKRNADVAAVTARLQLGAAGAQVPLASHSLVVWCGDLNYRLDVGEAEGAPLVKARQWAKLAAFDQLKLGGAFSSFSEEPLTWCPSYKFTRDGRFATDRLPAFTDRVLYNTSGTLQCKCLAYTSVPLLFADHLPVHALLQIHGPVPVPVPASASGSADFPTLFDLARQPGPPSPFTILPPVGEAAPPPSEAEAALGERPLNDLMWISPLTVDTLLPLTAPLPPWPLLPVPPLLWQALQSALEPQNARMALHPRGPLASIALLLGPGSLFPRTALTYLPDARVLNLLHPLQLASLLYVLAAARQLISKHGHNAVALAYVLSRMLLPEPRGGAQCDQMQRTAQFMLNLIVADPETPPPPGSVAPVLPASSSPPPAIASAAARSAPTTASTIITSSPPSASLVGSPTPVASALPTPPPPSPLAEPESSATSATSSAAPPQLSLAMSQT